MSARGQDTRRGGGPPSRRVARLQNLSTRFPRLQHAGSRFHARLVEGSGGRFGGRWLGGAPVLVLETVGRRTGRRRTTPIIYLRDGERFIVTPANAGAERTPDWWLNLRAAGEATAIVRGHRVPVRARVIEGAERERLWREFARQLAALDDYSSFTEREFPIVALEPQ
jgi:deazaflavin-dependent oxidoreductase (nitroreductase family)